MFKWKKQKTEVKQEKPLDNRQEFKLTFKMPRGIFKDMLPAISERKIFPIIFGEEEIRQIVNDFMVEQKDKIELDYGKI